MLHQLARASFPLERPTSSAASRYSANDDNTRHSGQWPSVPMDPQPLLRASRHRRKRVSGIFRNRPEEAEAHFGFAGNALDVLPPQHDDPPRVNPQQKTYPSTMKVPQLARNPHRQIRPSGRSDRLRHRRRDGGVSGWGFGASAPFAVLGRGGCGGAWVVYCRPDLLFPRAPGQRVGVGAEVDIPSCCRAGQGLAGALSDRLHSCLPVHLWHA